jgi:hypothetical protein
MTINRRDFLRGVAGTSGAVIAGSTIVSPSIWQRILRKQVPPPTRCTRRFYCTVRRTENWPTKSMSAIGICRQLSRGARFFLTTRGR